MPFSYLCESFLEFGRFIASLDDLRVCRHQLLGKLFDLQVAFEEL